MCQKRDHSLHHYLCYDYNSHPYCKFAFHPPWKDVILVSKWVYPIHSDIWQASLQSPSTSIINFYAVHVTLDRVFNDRIGIYLLFIYIFFIYLLTLSFGRHIYIYVNISVKLLTTPFSFLSFNNTLFPGQRCIQYNPYSYKCTKSIAQIPRTISHNAPFCNTNGHMCAYFCFGMVPSASEWSSVSCVCKTCHCLHGWYFHVYLSLTLLILHLEYSVRNGPISWLLIPRPFKSTEHQ